MQELKRKIAFIVCLFLISIINLNSFAKNDFSNFESELIAQNNNQKKATPKKNNPQNKKGQNLKAQQAAKNKKAAQKQQAKKQPASKAQNQNKSAQQAKPKRTKSNAIREEIQRYLGYESLLPRYLTLPYDTSLNSNVDGYYVEIGYFLLLFIPLILLFVFRRKPILGFTVILGSLFLLIISTSNGVLVKEKIQRVNVNQENLQQYLADYPASENFSGNTIASIYSVLYQIYQPINSLFSSISGEKDAVTYPILFLLFVGLYLMVMTGISHKSTLLKALVSLTFLFTFLWFLLAVGIIWYGYLMIPLTILLIMYAFRNTWKEDWFGKTLFSVFISSTIIWLVFSLVLRISNIYQVDATAGVHIYDAPVVKYQTGLYDKEQVIQTYFPGINNAIKRINRDEESLVYSVGTMFPFFIKKNNERILTDNLLAYYDGLKNRYNSSTEIAEVLKVNGFRYILVNLKLYRIDKTPEKSVEKKFLDFMRFLYQNEKLELLGTNRIVKVTSNTGQTSYKYEVFGDIHTAGTYAIYRIK